MDVQKEMRHCCVVSLNECTEGDVVAKCGSKSVVSLNDEGDASANM